MSARSAAEAYAVTATRRMSASITRRRLVQYVGMEWQDILAPRDRNQRRRDPEHGQLRVVTQFRLEHAFGDFRSNATGRARILLDANENRQLDLLFGYLEGTRIGRVLDFRLGRQLDPADLDFFAMDGLSIRLAAPGHARRYLSLQLWGGRQVRSDSPLGMARIAFETLDEPADALQRPRERGYLVGAAIATNPRPWIYGRIGMRRAFSRVSKARPEQALTPGTEELSAFSQGVEQSLAFAQLSLFTPGRRFFFTGSSSYDLARNQLSLSNFALTGRISQHHRVRLSWMHSLPLLDLDSIFSVFDIGPFQEARARYAWTPNRRWEFASRMHLRTQRDPQKETPNQWGVGGALSGAMRLREHVATLHTRLHHQSGRWQFSTLARWQWMPKRSRWSMDLWVHQAQALLHERRYALSGALSAQVQLFSGVAARALVETLTSQDIRQSTRVFAALTMDANLRVGGR